MIERIINLFEVISIIGIVLLAMLMQFVFNELPCPLCLLQRVGFLGIAFGFLLNIRFGFRPSHYAIVILSGLFTCFVALRQIALHIVPGTGAYGSAIFGLHLYTWSFIMAMTIVCFTTLLLGADRQYLLSNYASKRWFHWTRILFLTVIWVIIANFVSTIMECGLKACPDNPVSYELVNYLKGGV